MLGEHTNLDFVAAWFPGKTAQVERLANDPDFREICEHFTFVRRAELDATGNSQHRFKDLRQKLETELSELLNAH